MHNRLFFRENGHVIRTRRRMAGAAWPLVACLLLLGLLAWGHAVDTEADAVAQALEAGRRLGHQEMVDALADAMAEAAQQQQPMQEPCAVVPVLDPGFLRMARAAQARAGVGQ